MAITKQQFNTLEEIFDYYNIVLFANELPQCLINLSRRRNTLGFFAAERWQDKKKKIVHEISLNPDLLKGSIKEWHSTLVHEMAHLWEKINGTESRYGYHNKIWADKMEAIGLMPSNTGRPGGKRTGQGVSDYIIKGGPFDVAFKQIKQSNDIEAKLPCLPNSKLSRDPRYFGLGKNGLSGVRIKYTCPCQNRVWGKAGLRIKCADCDNLFMPIKSL